MGSGYVKGSKLNFIIATGYGVSVQERQKWQTHFQKASDVLHAATGGQLAFGRLWEADVLESLADAEVLLLRGNNDSVSAATNGKFGIRGAKINFYDNELAREPVRLTHEFGHHIWNLGDEYASNPRRVNLDRGSSEQRLNVIPINDSSVSDNELVRQRVIVTYGPDDRVETVVTANTTTEIVVRPSLPRRATLSSEATIVLQKATTCVNHAEAAHAQDNFCLMDEDFPFITQFCHQNNHVFDPQHPNSQQQRHGKSCWNTIQDHPDFSHWTDVTAPPAGNAPPIEWIRLRTAVRIILAIDVSGSMTGERLEYARAGIKYWLERLVDANPADMLGVMAFDTQRQYLLALSPASQITVNRDQIIADLDALRASGRTNIRDALDDSVTEFTSLADVATIQAVVLLTDGKHNTPAGSSILEMKQRLQDNNVKFAAIALGDPDDVDLDELTELADDTGGFIEQLDPRAGDGPRIEQLMIEAHDSIRGEVGEIEDLEFVFASPATQKRINARLTALYANGSRPKWNELCGAMGWASTTNSLGLPATAAARRTAQSKVLHVESGCERMTVTINYKTAAEFDLFLFDPSGAEVSRSRRQGVAVVRGTPAHQFITVRNPAAGKWTAVIVRLPSLRASLNAATLEAHLTSGMINPRVCVSAQVDRPVTKLRTPVTISASASWVRQLSGLRVTARVIHKSGETVVLPLVDTPEIPYGRGDYHAAFTPRRPGPYRVVVEFEGDAKLPLAHSELLLTHSLGKKGRKVSFLSDSKPFRRAATCGFTAVKGTG